MRLSLVVTALSVISLAACSSAPKAPSATVQANQAAAPASDATADAGQQAKPRKKYMNTGSRLPSESADPSVGSDLAGGLSNTTSNAGGGGPH